MINIVYYIAIFLSFRILFAAFPAAKCDQNYIQPILHSPGVYFDAEGTVQFSDEFWNVITHVDLSYIEPHLYNVKSFIETTEKLCKLASNKRFRNLCSAILAPLKVLLEQDFTHLESLTHLISNEKPTRFKRSLMNFGGSVLKFFFGTLDSSDAEKYNDAIEHCQQDEKQVAHLMKENIHIIQSSINSFNETISKLNSNENALNEGISLINTLIQNISNENTFAKMYVKINSMSSAIESSLLTLSFTLENTINSILFAKLNILHPFALTPNRLLIELNKHTNRFIKNRDFPVQLSIDKIHALMDISQLTAYFLDKKVIFILRIPLVQTNKFLLYKNIPLPTPHDSAIANTYALIAPTFKYMALKQDKLMYSPIDSLTMCKTADQLNYVCPLENLYSVITNPACETKLISEIVTQLPIECNFKVIYAEIDIWQRLNNNKWIFVQSKSSKLSIKCNDNFLDFTLLGTGILTLPLNCIAYHKMLTFKPILTHNITVQPMTSNFDIINDECCNQENFNESLPNLSPIRLSNVNLDSLVYSSHKLDNLKDELDKIKNEPHFIRYGNYYSGFVYFASISILVYLTYKLIKYFSCNKSNCCIKIYNQCNNRRLVRSSSKTSNSIEMTDLQISETSVSSDTSNKAVLRAKINTNN